MQQENTELRYTHTGSDFQLTSIVYTEIDIFYPLSLNLTLTKTFLHFHILIKALFSIVIKTFSLISGFTMFKGCELPLKQTLNYNNIKNALVQ